MRNLSSFRSGVQQKKRERERGREREPEREREIPDGCSSVGKVAQWRPGGHGLNSQMDVAQLVRLPNGDQVVMGSTPTFHSGWVSNPRRSACSGLLPLG